MPDFDPRWDGASIPEKHWHFHRQLYARYSIIMRPGEFSDLSHALRDGRAILVKRHTRGRKIYSHVLKASKKRVYVLANRGGIFTAWPPSKDINAFRKQAEAGREGLVSTKVHP